jgi:uncharacterized delta-60 repeat protein
MNSPGIFRLIVMGLALALSACGGGGDGDQSNSAGTQPPQSGIGAAGGTVNGPNGSKVEIPSGALAAVTQIAVDQTSANAPPLPAGLTPIGQMFAFTPHGTTFALPVTITMPFDAGAVPAGATPALFKTNAQNQWVQVAGADFGASSVSAEVSSFSFGQVVIDGFAKTEVNRTFIFSEIRNIDENLHKRLDFAEVESGTDFDGDMVKTRDFGPANFDEGFELLDGTSVARNSIATGVVESAADGQFFRVTAEAPLANFNVPGQAIGSFSQLFQDQTFIKREADATLTFVMPLARIDLHDENAIIGRKCTGPICDFLKGYLSYHIDAVSAGPEPKTFYTVGGSALLLGFAENWQPQPSTAIDSREPFWTDFELSIQDLNGASDSRALLTLKTPKVFAVDLSSIAVNEAFTIKVRASASAWNKIAGPPSERATSAGAYLNFDAPPGGAGSMFVSNGLEQVETPAQGEQPDPPPIALPPPCVPGPGPAGTLQFTQSSYVTPESEAPPTITVTRTGGTSGVVTALFATSDGTAADGTDYKGVTATVFFSDGDDEPRVVELPITEDTLEEGDETVQLTLSQPGGCGALGAQDSATLTIIDDDLAPLPSGLDPTFSGDGKATLEAFGGDRSGMAVQPDGKVIMVGGTFANFVMARFRADGTLDDGFGDSGKVTTPIVGSDPNAQKEATAVTLQRDGKIVVAGSAVVPGGNGQAIALVRYDSDGSIDDTFGDGGFAFGPTFVHGRAFAVAIDSQDRIVVAGDTPKDADPDFGDFVVARFRANGTLDTTFGQGGFNITDIGDVTNEAHGLKVLAGDKLLVSGFAPIIRSNVNGVDIVTEPLGAVVRYLENGFPDPAFAPNGRVALPGDNVGRGLAVQSDGKILLAGSVNVGTPLVPLNRFAVMRLLANGTIDDSFGTRGRVQTQFTDRGDDAFGVGVQADDKIVAAGRSSSQLNSNFAIARYESNGAIDTSFDQDGKLTIDFLGSTDIAENVAIQSNGKIVLGGIARDSVDGYGVARVLP